MLIPSTSDLKAALAKAVEWREHLERRELPPHNPERNRARARIRASLFDAVTTIASLRAMLAARGVTLEDDEGGEG